MLDEGNCTITASDLRHVLLFCRVPQELIVSLHSDSVEEETGKNAQY